MGQKDEGRGGPGERFIEGAARFIVALMWAALIGVVSFVIYLLNRFY